MIGIVIITHGELCTKLVETAEWIGVKSKNIETVSFFPSEGLDDLKIKISKAIERVNQGDGVVLLTDILHGSCSKIAGEFLKQEGIEIICGVNLAMIVSIISHQDRDWDLKRIIEKAEEVAKHSIVNLKQKLTVD